MRLLVTGIAVTLLAGCVPNTVRLPNQPGGPNSDLSSLSARDQWIADHPDLEPAMRDAIVDGVFIEGMTHEMVTVLTNPARRGTTGNGYWRRFPTGDETRLRWFVAGERLPFIDGRGRHVCELVLVDEIVSGVRYCEPPEADPTPTTGDQPAADSEAPEGG